MKRRIAALVMGMAMTASLLAGCAGATGTAQIETVAPEAAATEEVAEEAAEESGESAEETAEASDLFNIDVKALDLKVTDFKLLNKNGSIEVSDPILNNNKVTSNIIFNEVDDYVTFEFDLINQENKKYTIVGISDNNENENILFEYDYSNDEIAKNEKSNVKIKISYKNLLKNVEEVKLDNVKVTITLITDDGEKEDIVIPITGDSIHLNIIALIISIVVFIYCLSKLHINNKVRISLIVMMVLLIPSIIFAQEKVEVGIEFNSIYVKGKFDYFNVTIDKDSGEEPITLSKKYGSTLEELTAPEKVGYTFVKWVDENNNEVNVDTIVKTNYVIKAIYEANTNTPYKVLHYRENIDDDEYTLFETEDKSGTTDTNIVAQEKEYTGFTFETNNQNNIKTGNINGDGSLELKLYYKRNKYEVTYSFTNNPLPNGVSTLPTDKEYKYEETVTVEDEATAPGYEFNGWMMDNNVVQTFKMPANNVNLKGTFNAINSNYKVEHYYENINDTNYSLFKTDELEGTTDTTVDAVKRNDQGFSFETNNQNNILSGNVDRNGTLVLKLYYTRNKYEVTYSYIGDIIPDDATVLPILRKYKYDETVTVANNATAQGYVFSGWSRTGTFKMPAEDVTITGSFTAGTSAYTIEHYGQDVNGDYVLLASETEHKTGTTNSNVTGTHKDIENHTYNDLNHIVYSYNPNHPDEVSRGKINSQGTLTLKFYYYRNKYDLHIMNETNVTGASSGSYYYGTQLTLVANARDEDDEPFTKWSDGVTDSLTRTISITKDTNIGPYYHIYTVTLINKDPRTTVTTTTELEKVDPGSSIVLPELTKEECVYPKDATHTTPEERECTFIAEFMGWYTDEEHTNKVESPYFPSGDVTLYAKWNAVYYHYRLSGIREYSGTPGDYDDSGIILYNIDNRNRDFDINFDIVEYGKSAFPQSTIMNGKFEKQSLNYPGFVIRFNTNSWDKIEFTSRWGTKTVDQYATGTNIWLEPATATEPIHVNITRRDGVVKITYSTNQTGTSIPAGGKTLTMFDQNSSNSPVLSDNTPTTVTFGATIDEQGIPMRFFKGKLANMEVKLTSELYN